MKNSSAYLVSMSAPPSLEEILVDWLLDFNRERGFSSFPINGHSSRSEGLSIAEQVTGRQKRILFQITIPRDGVDDFLEQLKNDFGETGLYYWVTGIVDSGHLSSATNGLNQ